MKKKLTTKTIESLPNANGKRYVIRDTELIGLQVRVSNAGAKVFNLAKRVDGKSRLLRIGEFPTISLADARQKARSILRDIELGCFEPVQEEAERIPTLGEIIPQFIDKHAKIENRGWKESQQLLKKFEALYSKPIDEIKRIEVVRILDDIIASGAPVRANRALAALKKVFSWCVDRGYASTSPIAGLKPPTREIARDRVLTDYELQAIWKAASKEDFPFGPFLIMLILTGQRLGEVAGICWSEIDFENANWTIPGGRTKNKTLHTVPLSPLVIEILNSVPRFLDSDFVFTTTGKSPISGFGRLKKRVDRIVGTDAEDWRFHDIRRTVATNMAQLRISPHVIEAVLNHKSGIVSGVASVYNRHEYLDEKREALEQWAIENQLRL